MIFVALFPSLFVLSMSLNLIDCMYYISIDQEFDADDGNSSGAA